MPKYPSQLGHRGETRYHLSLARNASGIAVRVAACRWSRNSSRCCPVMFRRAACMQTLVCDATLLSACAAKAPFDTQLPSCSAGSGTPAPNALAARTRTFEQLCWEFQALWTGPWRRTMNETSWPERHYNVPLLHWTGVTNEAGQFLHNERIALLIRSPVHSPVCLGSWTYWLFPA